MEEYERAGHGTHGYAGLLIHRSNAHIVEVEAALREVHFIDIQFMNDPELVSRLVPQELQRNAEAWLVIYSPQDALTDGGVHDALVIPFPDGDIRAVGNDSHTLGRYAFRLLEVIRGSIITNWAPVAGVANLLQRTTAPEVMASRFQLIHSDASLFEADPRTGTVLPSSANATNAHLDTADIQSAFSDAIRDAAALNTRRTTLLLDESDASREEQQTESMVGQLAEINNRLAKRIEHSGAKRVVPLIVRQYQNIMDTETAQYLTSAATVAEYVKANPEVARDFEYSLPGCGVCKALEREVKNCLAPHIFKQPRNFTLGTVEHKLAKSAEVAARLRLWVNPSMHDYLVGDGSNDLPAQLGVITPKRNQVAHSDPVSDTEFDELWRLCLDPETSPSDSTLGKILEWKRQQQAHGNVE